jgi:hypothetical protein
MADHKTNVEIEDILSSIRRLVSDEARAPLVRQPPRLVLTAADRIDRPPVPRPAPPAASTSTPCSQPPAAPEGTPPDHPAAPDDLLEQRIAELEAMLGLSPAMVEPDEGDPALAPPAVRHRPEPAAAPAHAAPEPPHAAAPPREAEPVEAQTRKDDRPDRLDPEGSDPGILDEARLRAMVRDILRQELQGPLGERITHNIRKLVRAEIARALAAREL